VPLLGVDRRVEVKVRGHGFKGRASHRRHPRVHKSLPAIVAALKKHYGSGGGGVPR
jgi:hypothetical protein